MTVAGFDPDGGAVAAGRRAAALADRVTFEVTDRIRGDGYDVVFARIG